MRVKLTLEDILKLGLFPFIIFFTNQFLNAYFWGWYDVFHGDILLHLLGGLTIAGTFEHALRLLEIHKLIFVKKAILRAVFVLAGVITATVLWEFYEFFHDIVFGTHFQINNFDTMKDLLMGTIGGIIFCVIWIL